MPEKAINKVVAARLKAARKALGLSQASVGDLMGLPKETSSARVNRWEVGLHPPSLKSAEELAVALGLPFPALVSRDDLQAHVIAGLALLPRKQQERCWAQIRKALGPALTAEVCAKLAAPAAPAKKPTKRAVKKVPRASERDA